MIVSPLRALTLVPALAAMALATPWSAVRAQQPAQEPMHHPDCSGGVDLPPSGLSVADYLDLTFREQERFVDELLAGFEETVTAPPACQGFLAKCFETMSDGLAQAVAQGYLTGRKTLTEADAAAGVLEALEQHCLGTWTAGGASQP